MNPTERVQPGMTASESTVVTREVTVSHYRPGMPEVYGTPFMIYLMETAAANAIQAALPEGWVSVGAEVNIRHLAATPLGAMVTAKATVTAINDRRVTFVVEARSGADLIGDGTHVRGVIDVARFERRLERRRG